MGLMSAADFLKSKGSSSSPSSAPKGLISAKDFMIQKQQPVTDAFMQSEKTFGAPNLSPSFPTQPTYPTSVQGPVPIHPIQPAKTPSLADKVQAEFGPDANGNKRTDYPLGILNPMNDLNRLFNSPVVKTIQHGIGQSMGMQGNDLQQAKPSGNKAVDVISNLLGQGVGYMTNPAQIEQNVGNTFFNNPLVQKAADKVESLVGSKLPQSLGGKVITNLAKQATAGSLGSALYAPTQTLNSGGDLKDIPKNMLEQGVQGAAFGGLGGALGTFGGVGLGKLGELLKKEAPAPSYDGISLKSNLGGKPNPVQSQPSDYINSFNKLTNTEDVHSGLKEIDSHLADLETQYSKALDGQYSFLKDSLKNRQGINQGGLITDGEGAVTDRFGRTSNNPEWYQKFYKENGRVPNKKDLLNLAQDHVDNGFTDNGMNIPSWKDQVGYNDAKNSLTTVKSELNKSLSDLNSQKSAVNPMISSKNNVDKPLNVDSATNEPIKLTPKEQAKQVAIDKFSKIENNPIIPNTADQIQSKTGRESTSLKSKANQVYINTVDNAHRTNQFDQAAKKANNGVLNPSDSAYKLQLNARGQDMQASQIVNKNMINSHGEVTGQSLADVTKQIPKAQEKAFNDYVVARDSIARMGDGQKVYDDSKNMTVQKAKMIVDQYDKTNPDFKGVSNQYTQFHKDFAQQWYVDTGLVTQKQMDAGFAARPNYVPNKRIFSDLEKKQQFGSKGSVTGQSNPVKKAVGSQRQIVNPIESSIEDIGKGVKTASMNEAGQAIVRSLQRNPEELKGYAEIIHDHPHMDVNKMIQDEGLQGVIDHINKTFEDATRKPDLDKGNVVTVLMHGEPVHIRVNDPQFLEAISNLSPKGQDFVTQLVGKGTKVMKTLTTGVNPVFGLTRNIARDIPHAFISSKTTSNPIRFGADLLDGVTSVLADSMSHSKLAPDFMKGWLKTRGSLYNDYKNMGGGHSSSIASDRNLLAQSKEKILPSKGIVQTLKRNLMTKPYHMLENINNAAEAAPRLGEYKRTIKQGLSQGKGLYDSKVNALYEANDVTTNFNKFGNVTKNADAYLPYLNAAVQGLDQLVRMGSTGGAKRLTQVYGKAIGALTVPTVALYLLNHNNPAYQQTSNFIKDNYLLIPNGDGTFKKVAKPRELGMIFSTGVERALRAFNDHDPRAFQDFSNNFLQNLLPPGASGAVSGFNDKGVSGIPGGIMQDTIAGPIMDLERNKNFANSPIVPQDLLGLSPRNQYDAKTSEPAKFIGNMFNSSPKQLDFLAKSYLGVIGQLGIPATTKGGSISDTLKQQVNVDPTFSNDISRNFYDQKTKADVAKADAKFTGDPQKQDMTAYYDKIASQFTIIRKQMKNVQKDDTISNTDKRAKLKDLQDTLNKMQLNATR